MYKVQLLWLNSWVDLPGRWETQDNAEWAVGTWKQTYGITVEIFRVVATSTVM